MFGIPIAVVAAEIPPSSDWPKVSKRVIASTGCPPIAGTYQKPPERRETWIRPDRIEKRKDHGWEVIVEWHWPRPSDDFTTYLKTWRTKNPPELAKLREDVVQVSQVSSANFEVAHRDRDEGDVVKVRFDAKEGAFSSRGVGYA